MQSNIIRAVHKRVFRSISSDEWLRGKGVLDDNVIKSIKNAFRPATITVADLDKLGDQALKSLIDSATREVSLSSKYRVNIVVEIPHENTELNIIASEGDTIETIVKSGKYPELERHMECECGGNAACSTCHVIVDPSFFPLLPSIEEHEADMLDLALCLEETSRLGCQIKLTQKYEGMRLRLPVETNNLF